MKTINCCFWLLLLPFFVSCSNNEAIKKEINPIELSKRIATIDNIKTTDHITIHQGNGNYKITVTHFTIDEKFKNVPFEDHTKIYIEEGRINVERLSSEDFIMIATCLLTDSKGVKKTFIVQNPDLAVLHDFTD